MLYFTKTPGILRLLYKNCTWRLQPSERTVYLTFDDGPHPRATPFVLEQLDKYKAKASFFCIGKNVAEHPDIFQEIFIAGHAAGNHTYHHLNGWKTGAAEYLEDIRAADQYIHSRLFRPPYGKITPRQISRLRSERSDMDIIMWDVLSGDFDTSLPPTGCLERVLLKTESGSIVVFHDSEKAWDRMSYVLPRVLEYFSKKGFKIAALPVEK